MAGCSLRWSWFFCGVGFLLIGAFADNVRGPLLPVLAELHSFDYKDSSLMLVVGHFLAFLLTIFLIPALNRFSLRHVAITTCLVGVLVFAYPALIESTSHLYLWGACLGGFVSVCGTLCNLYTQRSTSPANRTRAMSAVHASYGLASFGAPLVAAIVLSDVTRWPLLYTGLVPFVFILLVLVMRSTPALEHDQHLSTPQPKLLEPQHWLAVVMVVLYVGAEVMISMWMTSWFMAKGHSLDYGASVTALFFILMTATRLGCSLFATSKLVLPFIWASLILPAVFFLLGRLTPWTWLIGFAGLLGPFFPLYISKLTIDFPNRDRTIVIWILAMMQAVLGFLHLSMGGLATSFGMENAYWLPLMLLGICMFLLRLTNRSNARS
jgi:FHS family glucose/mannose:H+ symporter-like MFS transporter